MTARAERTPSQATVSPDHDWWPGPQAAELPKAVVPPARAMASDLQRQLVDWRLLADRTLDPRLREALYRNLLAWEVLLHSHLPDAKGKCGCCRGRWGRAAAWPCEVFKQVANSLRHRRRHDGC